MNKAVFSLALASVLLSSAAFADSAVLSDVSGKVLVNKGKGFVPATASMNVSAGDKVMVGQGAFAVLSYPDCAVSVSKPSVVTVAEKGACETGPLDASIVQPAAHNPVHGGGSGGGIGGSGAGIFSSPGFWIGGGVVTAAVLVATNVIDLDDDEFAVSGP